MGADALGIDPLELARINAAEPGYVSPHGNRVTSCELKQCIDMADEMIDWKAKRAGKEADTGLGLACTVHVSGKRHFGDYDGGSATIKINEDGKALILCGEGECGQGAHTAMCQIAAEELGVPVEDVEISQGRHRPHDLLPRRLREPADLHRRQRGQERGDNVKEHVRASRRDARGQRRGSRYRGRQDLRQRRRSESVTVGRGRLGAAVP